MRRRDLLAASATLASTPVLAGTAAATAHASGPRRTVHTGFERLRASGYASLAGQRVGIISNPTGIDRELNHIVDVMVADGKVRPIVAEIVPLEEAAAAHARLEAGEVVGRIVLRP